MAQHRDPVALGLLGLLCFAVGAAAIHPVSNPDFGWHVALGRWVLANGAVPATEPFSHTATGAPMVAHQWASQALYALAIDSFSVRGLRFLNGAMAAGLVVLLFHWLRRVGAAPALALLLSVIWAVITENRLQLRPHMFNLLFFLGIYGGLFVARPRLSGLQIAGFVGLAVCWINLHSGAVLLPAIVTLYAAAVTVERHLLGRPPDSTELGGGNLGRLWTLTGLLCAALLVSPNHGRTFGYILDSARINADLSLEWFSIASRQAVATHGALELACYGCGSTS
jgi:hypothetical protein